MHAVFDRRHFLRTAARAGATVAAGRCLERTATAAGHPKQRIKIGQIGTAHEHASAKITNFRKLSDHYEVVVLPGAFRRPQLGFVDAFVMYKQLGA